MIVYSDEKLHVHRVVEYASCRSRVFVALASGLVSVRFCVELSEMSFDFSINTGVDRREDTPQQTQTEPAEQTHYSVSWPIGGPPRRGAASAAILCTASRVEADRRGPKGPKA